MSEDEYKSKLLELDKLVSELAAYEDEHYPINYDNLHSAEWVKHESWQRREMNKLLAVMGIKKPQLRG